MACHVPLPVSPPSSSRSGQFGSLLVNSVRRHPTSSRLFSYFFVPFPDVIAYHDFEELAYICFGDWDN